ncbi:6007_t:CDS:10 [Paraglomus occultum]|uniref:Ataxin-10 homolog n=1 Tax=Paraglomus occultum TaxID=144539 RepID=A0A9N8W0E2_9GLOM|nr:6007_t:CDS:10 [Paraglomus occultum]
MSSNSASWTLSLLKNLTSYLDDPTQDRLGLLIEYIKKTVSRLQNDDFRYHSVSSVQLDKYGLFDKDYSNRIALGREDTFWNRTTRVWDYAYAQLLADDLRALSLLLWLTRLFRNLVAGISTNQEKAVEYEWHVKVLKTLDYCLEIIENKKINYRDDAIAFTNSSMQALSNTITGHPELQQLLWSDLMNETIGKGILNRVATQEDEVSLTSLLMLVYNSIHNSKARSKILVESPTGIDLLKYLLCKAELLLADENSKRFEMIYAVISELIDLDFFPILYDMPSISARRDQPNRHQIALLKFLDSKLHSSDPGQTQLSPSSTTHLACIFQQLSPHIINSMKEATNDSLSDQAREIQPELMENRSTLYTALILLLQCFGNLSQSEDENTRASLFSGGVVAVAISLLRQAEETIPRITKPIKANSAQQDSGEFANVKRDLVNVIANMSYKNRRVQDEVRNLGGIPVILNQCSIDDANPFIREYAIFAVRNLLDNNFENQKLIEQLAPIEVLQHPAVSDIGLRAELNDDGRVHIRRG